MEWDLTIITVVGRKETDFPVVSTSEVLTELGPRGQRRPGREFTDGVEMKRGITTGLLRFL